MLVFKVLYKLQSARKKEIILDGYTDSFTLQKRQRSKERDRIPPPPWLLAKIFPTVLHYKFLKHIKTFIVILRHSGLKVRFFP